MTIEKNSHSVIHNLLSNKVISRDFIKNELKKYNSPLEAMVALKSYSLTWLVRTIFRNDAGEPLELLPFQSCLLHTLWYHKYPMVLASRGAGKSYIYALYALLRALLVPGSKVCIVGAGFRQAKIVFGYIAKFYMSSPILQEALQSYGGPKYAVDQCSIQVGSSYIFGIPLGDGERIRGLRANVILCDEFASISDEIYEIVIQPFAAVHKNPARQAKITKALNKLKKYNAPQEIIALVEAQLGFGNQICISGTASYEFNHFYKKYEMYRKIIFSGGDEALIGKAFAEGNKYLTQTNTLDASFLKSFKHTDYAIYQLPYFAIPEGFMDAGIVANSKLTFEPSRFGMEYLCIFAKDSDGFYKRSLIEGATPSGDEQVHLELFGDPRAQYVMGIDPARHNDNCAIVILKLTNRGCELVYSWAIRGKSFDIVVSQIRLLLARFNIIYIAMDRGGGGSQIEDMLSIKSYLKPGEEPIWRIDNEDAKFQPGRKILECFQWDNSWVREANHAMKAEIKTNALLFPKEANINKWFEQYCSVRRINIDKLTDNERKFISEELFGTFNDNDDKISEGCWDNILETINETCAIIVKVSENGNEQFILPSLSIQQKNQSLTDARRRDRYSALLLAAYAARVIRGTGHERKLRPLGGTDVSIRSRRKGGNLFNRMGGTVYPI